MVRDLAGLARERFDLIVVGGGIFGACLAWDAVLRGLSVALLERGDFAHATSANCFKLIHSGIRYLQHADLWRTRESIRERRILFRLAPHLVQPLAIAIPTYNKGLQRKEFMGLAGGLYDILSIDRNNGVSDLSRRIPPTHTISRDECIRRFPQLKREGLTGAAVIYEGQMHNPARLALEFLRSATEYGAQAANYVDVTRLLRSEDQVIGVGARDLMSGDEFEVLGGVVINATGPWAEHALSLWTGLELPEKLHFSRDLFFLLERKIMDPQMGLAIPSASRDPGALVSRGHRHLFVIPWRGSSLLGVWHRSHEGNPGAFTVDHIEMGRFLEEANQAFSSEQFDRSLVSVVHAGLVPINGLNSSGNHVQFGRRSVVADHARLHSINGLLSVIGVRYTTARHVAEDVIDLVFRKRGQRPPACLTDTVHPSGGSFEHFHRLVQDADRSLQQHGVQLGVEAVTSLVHNHGSNYPEITDRMKRDPSLADCLDGSAVTKAEVLHAVEHEMSLTLEDVALRRTDLCASGHPGEGALRSCAEIMAAELGWDEARKRSEIATAGAAAVGLPPSPRRDT